MKEQILNIKLINQNNLLPFLLNSTTKKIGFQTDFYHGGTEHRECQDLYVTGCLVTSNCYIIDEVIEVDELNISAAAVK